MKKMNKTRGIVYAILSLVIIACLGGIVLFGLPNWKWLGAYKDSGKAANITQGLDLKGGVSVTYQVSDDNPKWDATDLSDTVYKRELTSLVLKLQHTKKGMTELLLISLVQMMLMK